MKLAIFIHVPKTAGMSIDEALKIEKHRYRNRLVRGAEYEGIVTFGHELLPPLWRKGLVPRDAFCFAFCRNPYDRAVSLWKFNNKRNKLDLTFPEFCRGLDGWVWRIRYPQARWHDGVGLGFLGRFESLQEDFRRLCDALGVEREKPLPKINATAHGPYQDYYDAETRDIVRKHYARDFDLLGYGVDL